MCAGHPVASQTISIIEEHDTAALPRTDDTALIAASAVLEMLKIFRPGLNMSKELCVRRKRRES